MAYVDLTSMETYIDEEHVINLPSTCVPVISKTNNQIFVFVCRCRNSQLQL